LLIPINRVIVRVLGLSFRQRPSAAEGFYSSPVRLRHMFHRALSAAASTAGIIYSHHPPDTLTSAHITRYRNQARGHHSTPFHFLIYPTYLRSLCALDRDRTRVTRFKLYSVPSVNRQTDRWLQWPHTPSHTYRLFTIYLLMSI